MCGIAGIITHDGRPPAMETLTRLAAALAHRGPDGHRIYVKDNVGLVHRRLAIIDVEHGAQPLTSAAGNALIANGEIYNDPELRPALGGPFATGSDCESALALYDRHGEDFARHLRGMYAIAIHDLKRKRLVLARDPFGIKPLYYAETPQGFAFASEPQALVAANLVSAQIEPAAREEFFALQFAHESVTGMRRMAPGETIIVEGLERKAKAMDTWMSPVASVSEDVALKRFETLWEESVRVHQRSDVPYGMFLSGGIDSSAVLAMMARLNDRPVLAFTAAFPGADVHDERDHARAVAKSCGAEHVEVEIGPRDFWRSLPAIAAAMDDPAADYACVPTYLLGARAKGQVKVILTGEGGDEIFGGYGRYRSAMRPWPFRKAPWRRPVMEQSLFRTRPDRWRSSIEKYESAARHQPYSRLQQAQSIDINTWLPDDLLLKLDRCLMAHGIEGRVPFLDRELAPFAFSLPDGLKVRRGLGKWLLRRWLAQACPAADAFAKKRGFSVPVAEWIAAEGARLGPLVAKQPGIAEIADPGAVTSLFAHIDRHNGHGAWLLLFYALWHRRHMLGRPPAGDVFETLSQQ